MTHGALPAGAGLAAKFARLWGDEPEPLPGGTKGSSAAAPPMPTAGLWPVALDKIKIHGLDVQQGVDGALRAKGLATPQWHPTAGLSSGSSRAHPMSYLRLPDESRLFMTQTLQRGAFGKFRLGLWESPDHPSGGQVVALKELRLGHWQSYIRDSWRPRDTKVTQVADAKKEIDHHTATYSPLPVHGVVEHRGKLFISMPLLGDDLYEVHSKLSNQVLFDPETFAQLGLHLAYDGAEALVAMHAAGVIHRDLKPENFIHGPDHRLRLSDLGMAAHLDPYTHVVAGAMGTPGYVAPEVLIKEESGPHADVWSLMVTAVNLILHDTLMPTSHRDPQGIKGLQSYRRFHAGLRRDEHNHVRVADAIAQGDARWSQVFEELSSFDPTFADFVLNRGLNPRPEQRADASEVQEMVGRLLAARGIDPRGGAEALRHATAEADPYALAKSQLEAFAKAVQNKPSR